MRTKLLMIVLCIALVAGLADAATYYKAPADPKVMASYKYIKYPNYTMNLNIPYTDLFNKTTNAGLCDSTVEDTAGQAQTERQEIYVHYWKQGSNAKLEAIYYRMWLGQGIPISAGGKLMAGRGVAIRFMGQNWNVEKTVGQCDALYLYRESFIGEMEKGDSVFLNDGNKLKLDNVVMNGSEAVALITIRDPTGSTILSQNVVGVTTLDGREGSTLISAGGKNYRFIIKNITYGPNAADKKMSIGGISERIYIGKDRVVALYEGEGERELTFWKGEVSCSNGKLTRVSAILAEFPLVLRPGVEKMYLLGSPPFTGFTLTYDGTAMKLADLGG